MFKKSFILLFIVSLFFSCSSKKQLEYIQGSKNTDEWSYSKSNQIINKIQIGDILKIDVLTLVPEAAYPYQKIKSNIPLNTVDIIKLEGYLVDKYGEINFPVLGKISAEGLLISELENIIKDKLINGNHLTDAVISIRHLNSRFTILGEVRNPGTFSYFDSKINLFQALGFAGDLTIDGKRKDVKLIRNLNGVIKVVNLDLTNNNFVKSPYFFISNNDVIIVNPSFSKYKSAGFVGSPSSIASIASIILSVTLLLINN